MPVSPNLSLTLTREYGGSHEMTTINGSTISNTMWSAPPKWGNLPQWTLQHNDDSLPNFASGRRVWSLKFSYMDEGDLWGSNQSLNRILDGGVLYSPDIHYSTYTGASILVIQQNMQNANHAIFQYDDFTDVSMNGFTGTHTNGTTNPYWSRAKTYVNYDLEPPGIEFAYGVWYQVSFDLDIASGVAPEVCLGWGESHRTEIYRSEAGHNKFNFRLMSDQGNHDANCVLFRHQPFDATSTITVSNITVIPASSFATRGRNTNLLTENSFFSQVWQKTLGGTLPFIFQPDKDNNNVDQFAICKFRENSLKATQTAPSVYDISVVIEEVW